MKILFRDRAPPIIAAIKALDEQADAVVGSIFETPADAVVSPANSFGFMDGGIDYYYTQRFGPGVQFALQNYIKSSRMGELLIGEAVCIETADPEFRYCICAPTMRVPMKIFDPISIFLAVKAAVLCGVEAGLESIVFPGMGTGCGQVKPDIAAKAMLSGVREALSPIGYPTDWLAAQDRHFQEVR